MCVLHTLRCQEFRKRLPSLLLEQLPQIIGADKQCRSHVIQRKINV